MEESGSSCSTPAQSVHFHAFERAGLPELLKWHEPPLSTKPPRQLGYILGYLEGLGCGSVAIEDHYVDRDYMEDHATFYSRSLCFYPNKCVRAHFFIGGTDEIEARIKKLHQDAGGKSPDELRAKCREFSSRHYLGFMVVKPLPGCPVGRTVLRGPSGNPQDEFVLNLKSSMRPYRVHFAGIQLEVTGLAFQQQDEGVSACATTAIWSAFQKIRDFEEVAPASPAQITMLAAKYSLPFGRAMPSEGLSLDQMCLAVQALGASPHLLRTEDFETARGYLYSIAASGMCCILILRNCANEDMGHAVTLVGMSCQREHVPEHQDEEADDKSSDLQGLFVHDDRIGPYLPATPKKPAVGKRLVIQLGDGGRIHKKEQWWLAAILLPMHAKIRLAFAELWDLTREHLVPMVGGLQAQILNVTKPENVQYGIRVVQAHSYLEGLLLDGHAIGAPMIYQMSKTVAFSRYVGLVRLSCSSIGSVDVVIDTTSTLKNPIFLIVVPLGGSKRGGELARELAALLGCRFLAPSRNEEGTTAEPARDSR